MTTEAAMSSTVRATAAEPRGRLAYLDGWRAVAVAVVITSHVTGFRHEPLLLKQVARWLPVGEIGVLIFFFISGYVISRSALAVSGLTQHILFWGGLRGALALALAMAAPRVLPEHDALIGVAFAAVAFSIFVQGLTVPRLLRAANVQPSEPEET